MKGLLKATGKAVLYFLVYYAAQLLMFGIIGVTVSTQLTMEAMAQGQKLDYMVYYERYMTRVMELYCDSIRSACC